MAEETNRKRKATTKRIIVNSFGDRKNNGRQQKIQM